MKRPSLWQMLQYSYPSTRAAMAQCLWHCNWQLGLVLYTDSRLGMCVTSRRAKPQLHKLWI